jgi:hypothetical protein
MLPPCLISSFVFAKNAAARSMRSIFSVGGLGQRVIVRGEILDLLS